MHKNAIWIGFLLIVVAISLWFVVKAGYDIYFYFQLNKQIPVNVEKWAVEEDKPDAYVVKAEYVYQFKEKNYHGEGRVGNYYPNQWAADRAMQQFSKQSWYIWVNPKHPEKAQLEKKFPYKTAFSAAILLGLTIYFIILGMYVGVKHGR